MEVQRARGSLHEGNRAIGGSRPANSTRRFPQVFWVAFFFFLLWGASHHFGISQQCPVRDWGPGLCSRFRPWATQANYAPLGTRPHWNWKQPARRWERAAAGRPTPRLPGDFFRFSDGKRHPHPQRTTPNKTQCPVWANREL
jgi:hypothetical protein